MGGQFLPTPTIPTLDTTPRQVNYAKYCRRHGRKHNSNLRRTICASRKHIVETCPSPSAGDPGQPPGGNEYWRWPEGKSHQLTRNPSLPNPIHLWCGNTLTSVHSDDWRFQSELSAGSSRDRQVTANEATVRGLISTNSSTTNLSNSSISTIGCGMMDRGRRDITELSGSLWSRNTNRTHR